MEIDASLKSLTQEVLFSGYLLSLATVDEEGLWVADVIYTFDDELNIYWMSKSHCRHSLALIKHPYAAGTITLTCRAREPEISLQFSGKVIIKEDVPEEVVKRFFDRRQKSIESLVEEKARGSQWYKMTLNHLELIHGPRFGWDRKRVL